MIRAATGKPLSSYKQEDKKIFRPSSASAKLQSYAYIDLKDESRPSTSIAKKTTEVAATQPQVEKSKPRLDRRLTLAEVDGIGEHAKALTRLNTPASSKAKIKIEERITLEQLHKIKVAFEEADTDGSGTLDIEEFKTVVKTCLNVKGNNEDPIVALFMKIDSSSDGEIDWDEFCTYMQLEYSEKEESLLRSKQLNFVLPALSVLTPHHKAPILRVLYINDSTYLCAGQDGLLTFWSSNLKLRRTKSILEGMERPAYTAKPTMWITDVAVLSNHGKLLIGTGEREFHFYELITFEFYCLINGLESVPLTLDVAQTEDDQCLIVYGDDRGCVSIMSFNAIGDTLKQWKKMPKVKGVPTVSLYDVAMGKDTSFVKWKVHSDWVTGLRYFHELRSVISSSNDPASALVRGCTTASTVLDHLIPNSSPQPGSTHSSPISKLDKSKKHVTISAQPRQKADQSVFHVYKGVKSFDFCKKTSILATGGMDRIVRLWNPYVPQKPTAFLRGHSSPIAFIAIAGDDKRLFSISIDKCVKVWDLVEQDCLVSLNPKLHKVSGELLACVYADHCKTIAMATDHLSLLRIAQKAQLAGDMPVSHSEPVTCCAFNKSFNHVITCTDHSVVKLWDFETGNFMFEFNKAHGDSAITSITFDTSGRRLITAGRDGAVRIWNYNNGHCLRSLERENDNREVSSVLYVKMNNNKFIAAVGWDHRINIFPDQTDYLHLVQRPFPHWPDDVKSGHREDIVGIAYGQPNLLATVSYDGLIIVWNIISGHSIARIPFPRDCFESDSEDDDDIVLPDKGGKSRVRRAVNKIIFLPNRMAGKEYASLVTGCSDGSLIFWNIHSRIAHARFVNSERSRTLTSIAASEEGDELYVANDIGYVIVWDVEDYALTPLVDLPKGVVCPHRSKPPKRIACWRAHIQPITALEVIEANDVILTSSVDHTVRLWTTRGAFIGTFGQKKTWDIYDSTTWQHPMVPPEVLVDPQSLPEHPIMHEKLTSMEVIHGDSPKDSSDSEEEAISTKRDGSEAGKVTKKVTIAAPRKKSTAGAGWGGGMSGDAWRRKLTRRLSRNALLSSTTMFKDEEETMLDEVRKSMCKSAGKRLRHEKLMGQQRGQHVTRDVSSRAFKSLHYFELAYPPRDIRKPDPRTHMEDVFLIQEEEESVA